MRKISYLSILFIFSLLLAVACKEEIEELPTPSVTTNEITELLQISALSGGNIISSGGKEILACGICWSKNENPVLLDNYTEDRLNSDSSFSSKLTGLTANTRYYVRAYATNENGTGYGNQVSFTTKEEYDISENQYNWTKYPFASINWDTDSHNAFSYIVINDIWFISEKIGYIIGSVEYHESHPEAFKTTDGGLTWTRVFVKTGGQEAFGYSVHFFNENYGIFVCDFSRLTIFKYLNGEITRINDPNSIASPSYFIDSQRWFIDQYKTINEGESWEDMFPEVNLGITDYYFLNNENGLAVSSNGLILQTLDIGASWDTLYHNTENSFNCSCMINSTTFIVGGNRIMKSTDGGMNWYTTSDMIGITDIKFVNDLVGFAAVSGKIYKTIDGGEAWTLNYSSSFISFNILFVIDENNIIAAGKQTYANKEVNNTYIIKTITQGE